jgi:DNA-binding transcriptional regulator LsrR (DeoR family)
LRLSPDITTRTLLPRADDETEPIDLRKRVRQDREALAQELMERYQAGETIKTLAAQFGMHHRTVRKRLLEAGLELRPSRMLSDHQIQQAKVLYEQEGWTTHRIGTEFGVSHNTIRRHLHHLGVMLRPMGRPPRN